MTEFEKMAEIARLLIDLEQEANAENSRTIPRGYSRLRYSAEIRSQGLLLHVDVGLRTSSVYVSWTALESAVSPLAMVQTTLQAAVDNIKNHMGLV